MNIESDESFVGRPNFLIMEWMKPYTVRCKTVGP